MTQAEVSWQSDCVEIRIGSITFAAALPPGPEAVAVIDLAQELADSFTKSSELVALIRQSISECTSDVGSDDPKIHPPEISLLLRWFNAVGETPRLPCECIRCGKENGPYACVDDDNPGYICPDCYGDMQKEG